MGCFFLHPTKFFLHPIIFKKTIFKNDFRIVLSRIFSNIFSEIYFINSGCFLAWCFVAVVVGGGLSSFIVRGGW